MFLQKRLAPAPQLKQLPTIHLQKRPPAPAPLQKRPAPQLKQLPTIHLKKRPPAPAPLQKRPAPQLKQLPTMPLQKRLAPAPQPYLCRSGGRP
ncbi:alpha carbonic anhydrase 8-like [Oncorhynchus tshawytscha]|uniref:alpha carbonic anhydrase 8-like n=1 Tax=Oncorhynchus tshawytscha TaxID=74940 RepID=UPI001C3DCE1D|nr:alpha carbonic anhydrase 8-like [Oncorhynchus tshawytscha]